MEKQIDDELTYTIIGCAMKVHNTLGNGFTHFYNLILNGIRESFAFQEVIYQRCLAIELVKAGLEFLRKQEIPIYYVGICVGTRRADFIFILKPPPSVVVMFKRLHLNFSRRLR